MSAEHLSRDSMFQSTHPRGVRLFVCLYCATISVSIHAPAWGATRESIGQVRRRRVSIHAPAWGATSCASQMSWQLSCFNPRTRVGCDARTQKYYHTKRVSIHAPAWGATSMDDAARQLREFQSTHPRGVRQPTTYNLYCVVVFQSTHPRGVRRALCLSLLE